MIRTKKNSKGIKVNRNSRLTQDSKLQQRKWKTFWKNNQCIPSTQHYNLTICDDPKFIWFRNAKVGTRSIFSALDDADVQLTADHALACYYSPQKYKDYFKFAFVRNPWDRFVSGWYDKIYKNNAFNLSASARAELKQFENFVSYYSKMNIKTCNTHFRSQCALIDLNEVDYIGKFENFNEDLKEIFSNIGLPISQVPHKHKSSKKSSYQSYYTEETKQIIAELYQKDIQLFGYTF